MTARRDIRFSSLIITILAISSVGYGIFYLPIVDDYGLQKPESSQKPETATNKASKQIYTDNERTNVHSTGLIDPKLDSEGHAKQARELSIERHFQRAVLMLHAKRYDYALVALHQVLARAPRMPEAHANMGFTLLGMGRYAEATDFFVTAIELNPQQVNAYYGLAQSREAVGDIQGALAAMTTFIHLNKNEDDPFLRKAESAIWEWQNKRRKDSNLSDDNNAPEKTAAGEIENSTTE